MVWTWMLLALMLVAPLFLFRYRAHLPWAPACPRCRSVTCTTEEPGALDRLWTQLAATTPRRCQRCGWAGRMRWKLAAERARESRG